MAKTKRNTATPTIAAGGYPPPASDPSAHGAMQHLRTLNFILLNETKDLRENIRQLRSELADVSGDSCIDDGIQREVFGLVVSSHLASTAECSAALLRKADSDLTAEKAAAAETRATLLKKADDSAAKLCLANQMLLDASREKVAMEMVLKRAVEETDLCRSELYNERMKLKYMKQVSAQNFSSMFAAGTEYCRTLEEGVNSRERALLCAMQEINLLKGFLKEKMELIVELEKENERVREDGKMKEELLLESAMHDKELLEEQLTEFRTMYADMRSRKQGEINLLNAAIESNSSKILFLEEQCCCLDKNEDKEMV